MIFQITLPNLFQKMTSRIGGSVQSINRKKKILELLDSAGGIVEAAILKSAIIDFEAKAAQEAGEAFHVMDRKTYRRILSEMAKEEKLKQFGTTIPLYSGAPKQVLVSAHVPKMLIYRFSPTKHILGKAQKFSVI